MPAVSTRSMCALSQDDRARGSDDRRSGFALYAVFEGVLLFVVSFILVWILAGVALALLGLFHWAPVVFVALVGSTIVSRRIYPRIQDTTPSSGTSALVLTLVVVGLLTGLSAAHPGEHLWTGRDAATYLTTAGWLAASGDLLVDARTGPFGDLDELSFAVAGFYDARADGRLAPEFFHAFPVLLATAGQLGGIHAMLLVNPLVAGLALLAIFGLTCRIAGPWSGLAAVSLLGVNQAFAYFSRAPFSEPLALLFVAAGAWLMVSDFNRDGAVAFVGGMLLGGAVMARVDSLLIAIVLLGGLWLADADSRPTMHQAMRGYSIVAALGLIEVLLVTPWYIGKLDAELLLIGVAVTAVVAAGMAFRSMRMRIEGWFVVNRRALAWTIVAAGALAVLFLALIRPRMTPTTGHPYGLSAIQQAEGLPLEPTRTYAEQSFHWLLWYLGPAALVLGLWGLGILIWRGIATRINPGLALWTAMTALFAGVFLWRPSINPDHIWAMRRFLPVVLPGFAIAGAVALKALAEKRPPWGNGVAVAAAAVAVAGVGVGFGDVVTVREFDGLGSDFQSSCTIIGPDAAVLILDTARSAPSRRLMQSFRSFCAVPVAAIEEDAVTSEEIAAIRSAWASEAKELLVIAPDAETLRRRGLEPEGTFFERRYPLLEYTLTRRPKHQTSVSEPVWFSR